MSSHNKYQRWIAEAKGAADVSATTGGTFETFTGKAPGFRQVLDAPSAGLLTGLRAGLSDDPETKKRVFAQARFPNDPDALQRFGLLNGDVVFAQDGQLLREGTGTAGIGSAISRGAPALVGGTIGGVTGGPLGAGLGGAAGESARLIASNLVNDEPQTMEGNALDLAGEAVLNALGWKVGDVIGNKIIDRRTVRELGRLDLSSAKALQESARNFGIDLTAAESTGAQSLIAKQRLLQNSPGEAADVMGEFIENRTTNQIPQAVDRVVGRQVDAANVGGRMRDTANRTLAQLKADRATASRPFYQAADAEGGVNTEEVVNLIDGQLERFQGTRIGKQLGKIRKSLIEKPGGELEQDVLKRRIDQLHAVKLDIDLQIKKLQKNVGLSENDPTLAPLLQIKNKLLEEMSAASTKYDAARLAHKVMSKPLNEARDGLIGELAQVKDPKLAGLADRILGPNADPSTVIQARGLFERKAPGLWEDVLAVYLRKVWETSAKPLQRGANPMAGANFAKTLRTPSMTRNLRAAMGPDRYRSFSDFLDVLEATGRVRPVDSGTAMLTEAGKNERVTGAPIVSRLGPLKLREWWIDVATDKSKANLARVMTSPDALNKLRELRKLDPKSQAALNIVSDAIVSAGAAGTNDLVNQPPTDLPPEQ